MTQISIDECVHRYIAAIDEIYYIAEKLAELTKDKSESVRVIAADYLDGLVMRVDDMPLDIENIRDDASSE